MQNNPKETKNSDFEIIWYKQELLNQRINF
ncbi:hypothetical protein SAMN05444483_101659 [Salegentibacter echinorum]|uniref:Uncharacterized protein n=1 Tax=Salegentibacter echinorum TaxID=1073325 RepID=A0A1M5CTE4_SALEC|nr:hypothetical protein SAMN05444483_101659 [Salegentibacter echinorum]